MDAPSPERHRLPAAPESVPRLREAARVWARAAGLDDEQVGDVALAVSEAVTNAVIHAFVDREPGQVTLAMEAEDGRVVFSVADDGTGLAPRLDSPGLGLGLPTIGRIADHLDVGTRDGGGTEVRMGFDAPHLVSEDALRKRLEAAYGGLADAVTVTTRDGRIVYVNAAALEMLGASSAEEVVSRPAGATAAEFRGTLPDGSPLDPEMVPSRRLLAGEDDPPPLLTWSVHVPTGRARWYLTSATRLQDDAHDLAVNVVRDVTETTEAERRQRFLAEAGERLSLAAVDLERTFTEIARLAVPVLADWCAVDVADDDGILRRVALEHPDPEMAALGRSVHERWPPDPAREEGGYGVLRTGEPIVVPSLTEDMLDAVEDPEHRRALADLGMRSVILAPMPGRDRVVGVLTLVTAESARVFDEDTVRLALDLGRRAGLAVDNAFRMTGARVDARPR